MECLGALSRGYSSNVFPSKNEIIWVSRTYNPREPRTTSAVPVPRHKFLYPAPERLPDVPGEWRLQVEPPIYSYSRWSEEKHHPSSQSTRCEKWSTLREFLPSKERFRREQPSRWGVGFGQSFSRSFQKHPEEKQPSSFPHINSQMTRYIHYLQIPRSLYDSIFLFSSKNTV